MLAEIGRAWRDDRLKVVKSAAEIVERLALMARGQDDRRDRRRGRARQDASSSSSSRSIPGAAALAMRRSFRGRASCCSCCASTRAPATTSARAMVVQTLRAMALGGMRDHIGGGFHRYSVDGNWRVPHFEKMLYDQAQIVLACLEAAQAGEDPFFAQIAEDTLQYVRRDMTDERGGFYSAEDADSLPPDSQASDLRLRQASSPARTSRPQRHKVEGAFYVWTADEIRAAAWRRQRRSSRAATAFCRMATRRSIRSTSSSTRTCCYTAQSIADIAKAREQDADRRRRIAAAVAQDPVRRARAAASAAARRQGADGVERPDDRGVRARVARAGRRRARCRTTRERVDRRAPAERHRGGVVHPRRDVERRQHATLLRRYRAGDAAIDGYAEDYAYLIFGLLSCSRRPAIRSGWRGRASCRRARTSCSGTAESGGWFSTTGADPSVLVRMKEDYDGAEPSPTSVSAMNLLTLAHLTGERAYADRAAEAIASFGGRLEEQGRAVPFMAAALSTSIAGERADRDRRAARRRGRQRRCGSPRTRATGRSR